MTAETAKQANEKQADTETLDNLDSWGQKIDPYLEDEVNTDDWAKQQEQKTAAKAADDTVPDNPISQVTIAGQILRFTPEFEFKDGRKFQGHFGESCRYQCVGKFGELEVTTVRR